MALTIQGALMAQDMLIDDFSDGNAVSTLGTNWQGFTDQVMGGRSEIDTRLIREETDIFLRMTGTVSLENNGGFIQVRIPLSEGGGRFDATDYRGIRIEYRTTGTGSYYLHLRTSQTRLPWAHFAARIPLADEWSTFEVPWSSFESELSLFKKPGIDKLKSVGIVAAKEAFNARIDIRRISFYR